MSLDDFFAKKSKKKSKSKIDTQQLLEQIVDIPQPQKPEVEKKQEILASAPDDNDDWEPILNDDVELDLTNVRINDLSVMNNEQDQAAADALLASSKTEDSKIAWGVKQTPEELLKVEEGLKEEKSTEESTKTSAYVAPHLRAGSGHLHKMQAQPNLESAEEFPTLDAAKEKKKKVRTPEKAVVDTSWTEVNKTSKGHRMDDSSATGAYMPPSLRRATDTQSKYVAKDTYSQNLEHRYPTIPSQESQATQGWSRGDPVKNRPQVAPSSEASKPSWSRNATATDDSPRPYQPPHQRDILQFKQENRFAQLDSS